MRLSENMIKTMRLLITHAPNNQWFIQRGVASLTLESVIRGHHIYKSRWTPLLGETLNTSLELDNEHDKYAVSIVKSGEIVGHVPRSISKLFHFFFKSPLDEEGLDMV